MYLALIVFGALRLHLTLQYLTLIVFHPVVSHHAVVTLLYLTLFTLQDNTSFVSWINQMMSNLTEAQAQQMLEDNPWLRRQGSGGTGGSVVGFELTEQPPSTIQLSQTDSAASCSESTLGCGSGDGMCIHLLFSSSAALSSDCLSLLSLSPARSPVAFALTFFCFSPFMSLLGGIDDDIIIPMLQVVVAGSRHRTINLLSNPMNLH